MKSQEFEISRVQDREIVDSGKSYLDQRGDRFLSLIFFLTLSAFNRTTRDRFTRAGARVTGLDTWDGKGLAIFERLTTVNSREASRVATRYEREKARPRRRIRQMLRFYGRRDKTELTLGYSVRRTIRRVKGRTDPFSVGAVRDIRILRRHSLRSREASRAATFSFARADLHAQMSLVVGVDVAVSSRRRRKSLSPTLF